MDWLFALLAGYLIGSIPFGLLLTRLFGAGDIRQIGSGSIGATNVLRTGRTGLAAATVVLDAGKGAAAFLLAGQVFPGLEGPAAVAAVAGHCFPLWLGFRGGKGFATAAGACLVLAWPVFLIAGVAWATMVAVTRISSASSMTAVTVAPLAAWIFGFAGALAPLLAIAAIVLFQHRENLARIRAGTEPKIGAGKDKGE